MGEMYLLYPVPNVVTPRGEKVEARVSPYLQEANDFEKKSHSYFTMSGNDADHIFMSTVDVTWSTTAYAPDPRLITPYKVNPEVTKAQKAVWADNGKVSTRFYGTVPKSSLWASFNKPRGQRAVLAPLTASDVLFVIGHGSYRGDYLTHEEEWSEQRYPPGHEQYYCLRADMLANILMLNGLPKSHVFIKLNMCFGGGADNVRSCYARSVAMELGARGYKNVLIGAYKYGLLYRKRGTVLTAFQYENGAAKFAIVSGTELDDSFAPRNNPASPLLMYEKDPYRCWYNAKGATVRWNEADAEHELVPIMDASDPAFREHMKKMVQKLRWEADLGMKGLL